MLYDEIKFTENKKKKFSKDAKEEIRKNHKLNIFDKYIEQENKQKIRIKKIVSNIDTI